jgi:type II secretory pathway component PulK
MRLALAHSPEAIRAYPDLPGGFAFLLVLFILVLLVGVTVPFFFTSHVDATLSGYRVDRLKVREAIRGGLAHARVLLRQDLRADKREGLSIDALDEPWTQGEEVSIGDLLVSYTIEDERSRFPIARVVGDDGKPDPKWKERLVRLLSRLATGGQNVEAQVQAIVDWMDRAAEGESEEDAFEGAPNRRPLTVKELEQIPELSKEILHGAEEGPGLQELCTAWGGGQVNFNTASKEVLFALSALLTESRVDQIVEQREENPFRDEADLKARVGEEVMNDLSGVTTVSSDLFRVRLSVYRADEGETRRPIGAAEVVVRRSQEEVSVLYWDGEVELLPPEEPS